MPALIPLALTLAPSIAQWLFGAKGGQVAASIAAAAHAITGTSDANAQVVALADPAKADAFALELHKLAAQAAAEARQADLAELQATLADTASARSQTIALVQSHSSIAWGAPIVSSIVLGTFAAMLATVLMHAIPQGAEALANVMLGALAGMATAVVNYWVGSTASSKSKDLTIAEQSRDLATSIPASAAAGMQR